MTTEPKKSVCPKCKGPKTEVVDECVQCWCDRQAKLKSRPITEDDVRRAIEYLEIAELPSTIGMLSSLISPLWATTAEKPIEGPPRIEPTEENLSRISTTWIIRYHVTEIITEVNKILAEQHAKGRGK